MAAGSPHRERVSAAQSFLHAVQTSWFSLSKSKVFDHVEDPAFLRGFENGAVDCGLFVGDETLLNGSKTDILFDLRQSHPDSEWIIPIEIKTISYVFDQDENVVYRMAFQPKQYAACQAVILAAPREREHFALVPMEYIHRRWGNKKLSANGPIDVVSDNYRPLWTLHHFTAFPPK
ncbi:MAG: hypothetical protein Q9170_002526 [Blastenia crenularia]